MVFPELERHRRESGNAHLSGLKILLTVLPPDVEDSLLRHLTLDDVESLSQVIPNSFRIARIRDDPARFGHALTTCEHVSPKGLRCCHAPQITEQQLRYCETHDAENPVAVCDHHGHVQKGQGSWGWEQECELKRAELCDNCCEYVAGQYFTEERPFCAQLEAQKEGVFQCIKCIHSSLDSRPRLELVARMCDSSLAPQWKGKRPNRKWVEKTCPACEGSFRRKLHDHQPSSLCVACGVVWHFVGWEFLRFGGRQLREPLFSVVKLSRAREEPSSNRVKSSTDKKSRKRSRRFR